MKAGNWAFDLGRPMFAWAAIVMLALAERTSGQGSQAPAVHAAVLKAPAFKHYIDSFSAGDEELYPGFITNGAAWDFLKQNIPLFECPDKDIELTYYFRWWTYRKHIKKTPRGFVITEFLPGVPWAGKDNTINCAAGHHLYEGRWLADPKYLDDYSAFWFREGGDPRQYSTWLADAMWSRYLVNGDAGFVKALLPDLVSNYYGWEKSHLGTNGLFWQSDDRDGMEMSIGGDGDRPTINSYLYGDAMAISHIAELNGQRGLSRVFSQKAAALRLRVLEKLWDAKADSFKVLPRGATQLVVARELNGYTPWYFDLPDRGKSVAWKQLADPRGFAAEFGLTTVEQRDPGFVIAYSGHECQWNGPTWPFATSVTLTAMANLLNDYEQDFVSPRDYFNQLKVYARSQRLRREDGSSVPWIDEDLNPTNGDWIARTLLKQRASRPAERGKDYNHSTFCDLVITGLAGLRPRADERLQVHPLTPAEWDYFCLDQVRYHGHWLTILWDRTGQHYGKGKGLRILADGRMIAQADAMKNVSGRLPPAPLLK